MYTANSVHRPIASAITGIGAVLETRAYVLGPGLFMDSETFYTLELAAGLAPCLGSYMSVTLLNTEKYFDLHFGYYPLCIRLNCPLNLRKGGIFTAFYWEFSHSSIFYRFLLTRFANAVTLRRNHSSCVSVPPNPLLQISFFTPFQGYLVEAGKDLFPSESYHASSLSTFLCP